MFADVLQIVLCELNKRTKSSLLDDHLFYPKQNVNLPGVHSVPCRSELCVCTPAVLGLEMLPVWAIALITLAGALVCAAVVWILVCPWMRRKIASRFACEGSDLQALHKQCLAAFPNGGLV